MKRLAQVETSDEALSANKKKPTMATTTATATNEARQVSRAGRDLGFDLNLLTVSGLTLVNGVERHDGRGGYPA